MAQNGLFPVTYGRYGNRYWKRFTSYEFAANQSNCAIVFDEIAQAAAAFPIVFNATELGVEPIALLSLSANTPNPFVSQNGRWMAAYVPSFIRCHPFVADPVNCETDRDPAYRLIVNETSGLITNDPNHEAFFNDKGGLSPALKEVQTFLQTLAAARLRTRRLCKKLQDLGLLDPIDTFGGVRLPSEALAISSSRLEHLSHSEKVHLFDCGVVRLIHAHQVSLSHCTWLRQAQLQRKQSQRSEKYTENLDISGFLSAVANAQNDDFLGTYGV